MSVIGTLTVNLEANTAKFSGDLGKASQDAKNFGRGAQDAAEKTEYSMGEARHGVMMLGEEFGVRLPRALSGFIASIGPIGAAMEAAFPFLAIAAGAALLIEHLSKIDENAKKAAEDTEKAFSSAETMLQKATQKSLELQIELAELTGGPVSDLRNKLREVNDILASAALNPELKTQFDELMKGIDAHTVSGFNPLHWFDGVKIASEQVKKETEEAQAAIEKATTLEDKQKAAVEQLTAARLRMATQETYGNEQSIADQNSLISLLEKTKQTLDIQVSNQTNTNKVEDLKRERDEAEELTKAYEKQEEVIGKRFRAEIESQKQASAGRAKAQKEEDDLVSARMHADEAFTAALQKQHEEENKIIQRAADEQLKESEAMAQLQLRAQEENTRHRLAMGKETTKQAAEDEIKAVKDATKLEADALTQRIAALDKSDKDYLAKLQDFENKKAQVLQRGSKEIVAITNATEEKQMQAYRRMEAEISNALTDVIMAHQSFGQAISRIGEQVVSSVLSNAIQSIIANDMTKPSDAAAAARKAYLAGMQLPFPADIITAPILAAGAFAAVMGFEGGGEIPGAGPVPIMAHGGETVVTKALTDQVRNNTGGGRSHITYAPVIHAVDGAGVQRMLEKHSVMFERHFASTVRKMNRG